MKLLFIDIETSPNLADVWALWNQNISLSQLRESSRMICFAASWYGEEIRWYGEHHTEREEMIDAAWQLVDQADVVCHYNGRKFDMPTLNKEFVLNDYWPPAPYQQLDLLEVVRRRFRFPSNKLEYVADALGLSGKMKHSGHELWVRCMQGDGKAWMEMAEYNQQDVRLLVEMYDRLLPWISNHPSVGLYDEKEDDLYSMCPYCDGADLTKQGFAFTRMGKYQRYRCQDCGGWSQDSRRIIQTELRSM